LKIYYLDIKTGKVRWTNPQRYEVKEIDYFGTPVKAIYAYGKSDYIVIPSWALAPQSKHLLAAE
jgi:hypothetical protein